MKKIASLTVIFAVFLVFFPSCIKKSDPLAYEKGRITAEIIITMNGTSLRAKAELDRMTEGEGKRNASLVFLSPESVSGLSVSRTDGKTEIKLGDFTPTSFDGEALLSSLELFSTGGSVVSAETDELDGEKLTRLTVLGEGGEYTVYLTDDGLPRRITHGDTTLDTVWVEFEK